MQRRNYQRHPSSLRDLAVRVPTALLRSNCNQLFSATSCCFFSLLFLATSSRCYFSLLLLAAISRCYFSLLFLTAISHCFSLLKSLRFIIGIGIGIYHESEGSSSRRSLGSAFLEEVRNFSQRSQSWVFLQQQLERCGRNAVLRVALCDNIRSWGLAGHEVPGEDLDD